MAEFLKDILHNVPGSLSLQYQFVREEAAGGVVAQDKYAGNKEVLIEAWPFTARPDVMAMMDFQSAVYDLKFNPLPGEAALIEARDDSYADPPMLYIIQEYKGDSPGARNLRIIDLLAKHLAKWLTGGGAPAAAAAQAPVTAAPAECAEAASQAAPAPLRPAPLAPAPLQPEPVESPEPDSLSAGGDGQDAMETPEPTMAERAKAAADAPMVAVMARLMAEAKEALNKSKSANSGAGEEAVPADISPERAAELQELAVSFTIWSTRTADTAKAADWEKRFDEATSFNERAAILEEWNEQHKEELAQAEAAAEERANRYSKYRRYGKGDKSSPLVGIIVGAIWLIMMFILLYIGKFH